MLEILVAKILVILGLSRLPSILLVLLAIESYLLSLLFYALMIYRYRAHRRISRWRFILLQFLTIGVYATALFSLTVLFSGFGFFLTPVVTALFCGVEAILITGRTLHLQAYSRLPMVIGIFGCAVLPWFLISLAFPLTGVIFLANNILVMIMMLYLSFAPGKVMHD